MLGYELLKETNSEIKDFFGFINFCPNAKHSKFCKRQNQWEDYITLSNQRGTATKDKDVRNQSTDVLPLKEWYNLHLTRKHSYTMVIKFKLLSWRIITWKPLYTTAMFWCDGM